MTITYYYIVMDQMQMFLNQPIEEVLREKTNHYFESKKEIDFWILVNPKFLNSSFFKNQIEKYLNVKKIEQLNSSSPSIAVLISRDKKFIDWIKLRIGNFGNIYMENTTNVEKIFDGLYGTIEFKEKESILEFDENYLSLTWYKDLFEKNIVSYFKSKINTL